MCTLSRQTSACVHSNPMDGNKKSPVWGGGIRKLGQNNNSKRRVFKVRSASSLEAGVLGEHTGCLPACARLPCLSSRAEHGHESVGTLGGTEHRAAVRGACHASHTRLRPHAN